MTDSPSLQAPLDPKEEPILSKLLEYRDQLSLLKQDKSTYVKCGDVIPIYDEVIDQVHQLNTLRQEGGKPLESNRVDRILDDCFQLISLFFLTVGRNSEAPAVYSMSSTVKRLLDHLTEAAFFTGKDMESISHTLNKMQGILERGKEGHSPQLLHLLNSRMVLCRKLLADLKSTLDGLSSALVPVHERLVSILRSIAAANTRSKFPTSEVEGFRDQLREIKASMKDGKLPGDDEAAPDGQEIVIPLLERCLIWADIVLEKKGRIDPRFKATYDNLIDIRNQLERLSITQAWSLRETDLYNFQRQLDRVDESRVNGNFEDSEGHAADLHAQRTLLYLLRRSYAYIYTLMIASEPVSEALLPIYNQLSTLRRCLQEVKRSGGVGSARELYPYSMKLSSIDDMRVDGKFKVGSDVPEGQASINALLGECFDIQQELKAAAEDGERAQHPEVNGNPKASD